MRHAGQYMYWSAAWRPLPKSVRSERVAENIDVFKFEITPAEMEKLMPSTRFFTEEVGQPRPDENGLEVRVSKFTGWAKSSARPSSIERPGPAAGPGHVERRRGRVD